MSKYSPVYRKAEEVLADGEWHDLERVIYELTKVVPPGRALRQNEYDRQHGSPDREKRYIPRDTDRLVRSGARTIIRDTLRGRRFELDMGNGRVRLRPQSTPQTFLGTTAPAIRGLQEAVRGLPRGMVAEEAGVHPTTLYNLMQWPQRQVSLDAIRRIHRVVFGKEPVHDHVLDKGVCTTCFTREDEHVLLSLRGYDETTDSAEIQRVTPPGPRTA